MSTENRKKRKHSDSDAQARLLARSEVWFDDGNLIVRAEDTLFRVYRGVLAYHAPGMVELLNEPERMVEHLEGVELLVLQDAADDIEVVFKQLFHRTLSEDSLPSFAAVAARARIGKKYTIMSLYVDAVARLSSVFPSTVEGWLNGTKLTIASMAPPNLHQSIALQTLVVAREFDLTTLLPAVFFWLSLDTSLPLLANAHAAGVSQADIVAVLEGVQRRRAKQKEILTKWLGPIGGVAARCRTRDCIQQRPQLLLDIITNKDVTAADALHWKWKTTWEKSFCVSCIKNSKAAYEKAGKEMWDKLPGMFGLGSWNEILGLAPPPAEESDSESDDSSSS